MMKPMLCKKATLEEAKKLTQSGWKIETKFDGIRGVICDGRLFCKRGNDITERFPEFKGIENIQGTFDGEIISESREFNDIAGRMHMKDKFKISLAIKTSPAIFMAFDKITNCTDAMDVRRNELTEGIKPEWFQIAKQYDGDQFDVLWEDVLKNTLEGLVIKQPTHQYAWGKRSPHWLKVKNFEDVVAEFVKYEETTHGIVMTTADGRRVNINGAPAVKVKAQFDKHGKVTAEIQHLPQKNSKAWRFPSFVRLEGWS